MRYLMAICLVGCTHGLVHAGPPSLLQVHKFAEQVWKPLPSSVDMLAYRERTIPEKSEQEIRARIESVFQEGGPGTADISEEERQQLQKWREEQIEANVERTLEEHNASKHMKQRFRISGSRYRVDQVIVMQGESLGEETEFEETFVNNVNRGLNDYSSFSIHMKEKHAKRYDAKEDLWKQEPILYMGSYGQACFIFRAMLGEHTAGGESSDFLPSEDKLEAISEGRHPLIRLEFAEINFGSQNCHRFELWVRENKSDGTVNFPSLVIIVDSLDYSKCYKYEITDHMSGKVITSEDRADYDA